MVKIKPLLFWVALFILGQILVGVRNDLTISGHLSPLWSIVVTTLVISIYLIPAALISWFMIKFIFKFLKKQNPLEGKHAKRNIFMLWLILFVPIFLTPMSSSAYKTYTSDETGFSLKYPATVEFYESGDSIPVEFGQTALEVYALKMDEKQIDNDESTPIEKKIELKKAAQDLPFDQDAVFKEEHVAGRVGYQVINIGKSNVKASVETYLMGERVAQFIRFLVFYHNGYEVHIVLTGHHASIISDSPAFFKDAFNGYSYWMDDDQNNTADGNRETPKMREFYSLLESGKGPDAAQRWYSDFDQIVDSIEFK